MLVFVTTLDWVEISDRIFDHPKGGHCSMWIQSIKLQKYIKTTIQQR